MLVHRPLASWFVVCVLALSLTPVDLSAQEAAGKRVALLVGVNKYDKRGFRDLEYAERDVEELADVLKSAGYEVHLLTGTAKDSRRAVLKNIEKGIETVLTGRKKNDLILVALAGHGLQIEVPRSSGKLRAEAFYCPADAEQGNAETMLALGKLFDEIDRRGGGHNLILVDACREDPTRGRGLDGSRVALSEGIAALFGCRAGQKTFETKNAGGGHGVFFHFVLEGLRGKAKNSRGEVTWSTLVDYVAEQVPEETSRLVGDESVRQTPNEVRNLPGRSPVLLTLSSSTSPVPKVKSFAGTKPGQEWNENSLKMKFCWCPPGKFTMGSPKEEEKLVRYDDEHQVSVTISRGFWLGKYEVTLREWDGTMDTSVRDLRDKAERKARSEGDEREYELHGESATTPMHYVTHDEALDFGRRLTDQERKLGRLPEGWEYRLPTEAQWEYACRAGTTTKYSFGNDEDDLKDHAWYSKNATHKGGYKAREVGGKRANPWGLHDMHGNLFEWCRDRHFKILPGGNDPDYSDELESPNGVIRGGSVVHVAQDCRSAVRDKALTSHRMPYTGLRVALVQSSK